ncbi:hypothetical protein [Streptomyces massasporeus]|uniref:hypothetical protein n=1 Tax=Streptomyces massasporeus TaxID=67324 RepID=UPI0033F71816
MTALPSLDSRPALPRRPIPHERTPDRPTPADPRPHPQRIAQHDELALAHLARRIGAAA